MLKGYLLRAVCSHVGPVLAARCKDDPEYSRVKVSAPVMNCMRHHHLYSKSTKKKVLSLDKPLRPPSKRKGKLRGGQGKQM